MYSRHGSKTKRRSYGIAIRIICSLSWEMPTVMFLILDQVIFYSILVIITMQLLYCQNLPPYYTLYIRYIHIYYVYTIYKTVPEEVILLHIIFILDFICYILLLYTIIIKFKNTFAKCPECSTAVRILKHIIWIF